MSTKKEKPQETPKETPGPPKDAPIVIPPLQIGDKKQIMCTLPDGLAVFLKEQAFGQLFGTAYATRMEISLLGLVARKGHVFVVEEFFLVRQSGSTAHTELDPEAVAELIERLMKEGRSDDVKRIRCWAHSHPAMDVFWSGTDDKTCRLLATDWLLSVVVSENFKIRCRLDVMRPIHFTVDDLPVFFEAPISEAVVDRCAKEVKEKIKVVSFLIPEADRKEKTAGDAKREPGFCGECGGTHAEGECPLRFEAGYELARQERELGLDRNLSGDEDLYF